MSSSVWSQFGLAWASMDRPEAHARLVRALLRWDVLPAPSRAALRELVLLGGQPSPEMARELEAVQLVGIGDGGRVIPLYPGAGLVALEEERRSLPTREASSLLAWYRRGLFQVRKTYGVFQAERFSGDHEAFAELGRRQLVERREERLYRSTVRGWAVARLVEDATPATIVDDDGPTRRWAASRGAGT